MRVFGQGKCSSIAVLGTLALALNAGCGGSDPSGSTAGTTVNKAGSAPTQVALHPVRGSGVSGRIVCIKLPSGTPLVRFRLRGLRKAPGLTQYMIWQMGSRHNMTFYK